MTPTIIRSRFFWAQVAGDMDVAYATSCPHLDCVITVYSSTGEKAFERHVYRIYPNGKTWLARSYGAFTSEKRAAKHFDEVPPRLHTGETA